MTTGYLLRSHAKPQIPAVRAPVATFPSTDTAVHVTKMQRLPEVIRMAGERHLRSGEASHTWGDK